MKARDMILMAIDPGPTESAAVVFDAASGFLVDYAKDENYAILDWLQHEAGSGSPVSPSLLAVEMIASYGMPVGAETFATCVWAGRFIQAWGLPHREVYRREVKLHLCGTVRAKDANVRRALLDRFGPGKAKAIGTAALPGPLYGVKADVWQALAVAVTVADTDKRLQELAGKMAAAGTKPGSTAELRISSSPANDNEVSAAKARTKSKSA